MSDPSEEELQTVVGTWVLGMYLVSSGKAVFVIAESSVQPHVFLFSCLWYCFDTLSDFLVIFNTDLMPSTPT